MCSSCSEYGDPEVMAHLVAAVDALRDDMSVAPLERAAQAARTALPDANPWTRTLARGVQMVVDLARNGDVAAACDLLEGELTRALPAHGLR
jgi:hypothetical protein